MASIVGLMPVSGEKKGAEWKRKEAGGAFLNSLRQLVLEQREFGPAPLGAAHAALRAVPCQKLFVMWLCAWARGPQGRIGPRARGDVGGRAALGALGPWAVPRPHPGSLGAERRSAGGGGWG